MGKLIKFLFDKALAVVHPLDLLRSSIRRLMKVKARHGASYFLTLIDDYFQCRYINLTISEALVCFKCILSKVANQKKEK